MFHFLLYAKYICYKHFTINKILYQVEFYSNVQEYINCDIIKMVILWNM